MNFLLFVPPVSLGSSSKIVQLFSIIPLVSVGTILIPNLNTQSPETVTKVIGWSGLVLVTVILIFFKSYLW